MQRIAIAFALASMLAACRDPKVSLATGTREYVAADYPQVMKRWTRSKDLLTLTELENLLTVTATFESWDFRWSYVIRYAQDYRLTVEQRRELLDKTLDETRTAYHFYVALYGATRRATDLTKRNTNWVVRLIDDQGNETAPSKLEYIRQPGPLERTYYPYTTVWRSAYRITFPFVTNEGQRTIATNARWIGLRFAGVEGNQELRWELEPFVRNAPPFARTD